MYVVVMSCIRMNMIWYLFDCISCYSCMEGCLFFSQPPVDEAGGEVPKGEDEEEHEEIPPTPVPKEWECLGSDLEIKETFMEPGRPLVIS